MAHWLALSTHTLLFHPCSNSQAVHRQMVELAFKSGPIDAALDRFCAVIDKAADILPAALGLVLGGALHLQKALLAGGLAHLNKVRGAAWVGCLQG